MAGFDRYNSILTLFSERRSSWTVAEIEDALGTPASTVYRIMRELVAAGFIESAAGSHFRLGPAFVEFDRTINKTDPLIRSGVAFLDALANQNPIPSATVLARLYGDKVMCVADSRSLSFKSNTSYQRGRPMPITRSATSRVILAQISGSRRDRLLATAQGGGVNDKEKLKTELAAIRRSGMSTTRGEVDKGLMGCAVPVRNRALGIEASLSSIFNEADFLPEHEPKIFANLSTFAKLIENHMQSTFDELDRQSGVAAVF